MVEKKQFIAKGEIVEEQKAKLGEGAFSVFFLPEETLKEDENLRWS